MKVKMNFTCEQKQFYATNEKGRLRDPLLKFLRILNYFNTILLVKLTDLPATRTM